MNAGQPIRAFMKAAPNKAPNLLDITISEGLLFLSLLFAVHLTTYHYSYLLFHTIAELFSIFIATTITIITINCWSSIENRYLSFTGISYLFVGVLDLLHTLSFKGMPIFTDYDYYAPQFWIAARYVESLSLLAGFGLLATKRPINPSLVTLGYVVLTACLVATILYYKTFPVCYIAGKGLTPFKIVSECIICTLLTGSIILLYVRRMYFDARVFRQVLTALVLMVCQELCFTVYMSDAMSNALNETGHLLKICAFYLIYKAIVVTALRDPINLLFRELGASETSLREAQALAHLGRWKLDLDTGAWTWTAEMYRFFSVAGSVTPALDAMLAPLQPQDQRTLRALLSGSASHGTPFEFMLRIEAEAEAGQARFAQLRGEVQRDERGRVTCLLGTLQDVTGQQLLIEGLKERTAQLQERTAALEQANKELESFSYSVSHDLRTPLRAIAGFSRILREEYGSVLGEEGRRHTETICSSAVRMGQLISDILDFAHLSRREIALAPVDMNGLAREVYEEVRGEAERNIVLHIGDLPPARGDQAMLRQVWVNLISNAVKYTGPRAEAVIEVGGSTANGENTYWVKDNGVGFDMRYVDKLFGVFQRLHSNQEFEGTGIGLAIVKRIVTRHGGRVWAESELGKGTTLYFALPAMNEEEAGA